MRKILCIVLFTLSAHADIADDLTKTFDALNMSSNINRPKAWSDQHGGYYTGGSIFIRNPIKNTNIANVQVPSFNAGCGGIDLFTGGLSFLSASELVKNMKAAIPASIGYGFALAMQTITPQLYNVMTEMQDWAQKINAMNINSCEMAALGVGGAWPKSDAASKYMCNTMGTQSGVVSDWVKGRHECGKEDLRAQVNSQQSADFADSLGNEFNLVWKAIKKNGFLQSDKQLAEFFMSISGTIVRTKKSFHNYPSLIANQDLIKMLLTGKGNAEIYSCIDDDCLQVRTKKISLKEEYSLHEKVSKLLESMIEKVVQDNKATDAEMGLVNSTGIPIMKILTIESAYKRGSAPISLMDFSEAISYDILLKYLDSILDFVSVSLKELQQVQIESETIDSFRSEIRDARARILEKRNGVFQQMVTTLDAVEKAMKYEKELHHTFDAHAKLEDHG